MSMKDPTDEEIIAAKERERRLAAAWKEFRRQKRGGRERRLMRRLPGENIKSVGLFRTGGEHDDKKRWRSWDQTNRP